VGDGACRGGAAERHEEGDRSGLSWRYQTASKALNEIRHIVLDIGKVLVHYDPHLAFLELIADEKERAAFLREVCSHDWNIEQDRGRSWEEAEMEAIGRHPDKADLIRAFRGRHHMMISHAYEDSVDLLRALLKRGHDVTLLTNFASDTFRETQARFPFLGETRGVTVSGDVKLVKPDPAIFMHHTKAFGLEPEATLFFDDSAANVEGARAAGWHAEIFTSAEKMCEDLARYGIAL
jgi:2-haloacid dehalogenase